MTVVQFQTQSNHYQTNPFRMSESMNKRKLIAAIADEDTVTGLLLAGIGQISNEPGKESNF